MYQDKYWSLKNSHTFVCWFAWQCFGLFFSFSFFPLFFSPVRSMNVLEGRYSIKKRKKGDLKIVYKLTDSTSLNLLWLKIWNPCIFSVCVYSFLICLQKWLAVNSFDIGFTVATWESILIMLLLFFKDLKQSNYTGTISMLIYHHYRHGIVLLVILGFSL